MAPETVKFLIFIAFSAASLIGGYVGRKSGKVHEESSRWIHWVTVVWIWPAAAVLSIWPLPIRPDTFWLIPIEVVLVAVPAFAVIPIARRLGCDNRRIGVLAVAAGVGNLGFTLGGYLCFAFIEPREEALAYAIAQVSIMSAVAITVLYPLAQHYGPHGAAGGGIAVSPMRLVLRSLWDVRAMQMYAAIVGVGLAALAVPFPRQVIDWHILDVVFFLGAFTGYFGIGLRLRLGDSTRYIREHLLLGAAKFLFIPALSLLLIWLISLTPYPLAPTARQVILLEAFMPTAIQSVIVANLFHLDSRLASVAWVWNAVAFLVLVLPVMLWLMA
jgi:predicted permease